MNYKAATQKLTQRGLLSWWFSVGLPLT